MERDDFVFVPIEPPEYVIALGKLIEAQNRFIAEYYRIPVKFFYRKVCVPPTERMERSLNDEPATGT